MTDAKTTNLLVTMIDDEEVVHFIFQTIAKKIGGIDTAVYGDAMTVLKLIEENKFETDLILLDINMPYMSGWDFLDALEPMNLDTPIVIVSSSRDRKDVEKSKQYKAVKGFYAKPLSFHNLREIIDAALINNN
ncbi:response regulator [Pseudochryseolinea flava]|uniref:Response regulator n=1 Tax=Pseudochryseolinea flava TaxID=2059302 RepID=A0A364Y3X4_9BACT|nr:response regulator [Pseudochryseolinea flava]RAW00888.1 response regulator [Pseudochryseolinea flava]